MENREVVYFWLPAAAEAATVREIGKLAIYTLLTAAYQRGRSQEEKRQCYLVIDEFQRIASENFKIVLEQARSMGISAVLANQTVSDLKTNDTDLRTTVQTNTRFKQCFSSTDLDYQDALMKASGERVTVSPCMGFPPTEIRPKTSLRRWKHVSFATTSLRWEMTLPGQLVQIHRGSGYSQFSGYSIPVTTSYSMSKDVYDERCSASWPEVDERTMVTKRAEVNHDFFRPWTSG